MSDNNYQPLTRKAMREQAEAIAKKQTEESTAETEISKEQVEQVIKDVELDADGNPIFRVSTALTGELTATNIVIEPPTDITAGGSVISDAGEIVVTGSIDVTNLVPQTGEIDPIMVSDDADNDLDKDAKANYIPGIPPIRVSGVIAKTTGQAVMPGGAHRGLNPYLIFGLICLAAVLIGSGVGVAFFLGGF